MGMIYSNTSNVNSNTISTLGDRKRYNNLEVYDGVSSPQYIFPIGNRIIDLLDPTIDPYAEFFFYDGEDFFNYIYIYTDGTNWINFDTSSIEDNTVITQNYSIFVYLNTYSILNTFPLNSPFAVEKRGEMYGKLNQISPQEYISGSREYIRSNNTNLVKLSSNNYSGIYPNSGARLLFNERWEYYTAPTNLSFTNPFSTGNGIPKLFWYNSNPLSFAPLTISNVAPSSLIGRNYTPSPIGTVLNTLVNDDITFDSYLTNLGYVPATFKTDFANTYGISIDFSKHFLHMQAQQGQSIPPLQNSLTGNFLDIRTNIGIVIPTVNNYFNLNLFYKETDIFNTVNLYFGYNTTPFQQLFL